MTIAKLKEIFTQNAGVYVNSSYSYNKTIANSTNKTNQKIISGVKTIVSPTKKIKIVQEKLSEPTTLDLPVVNFTTLPPSGRQNVSPTPAIQTTASVSGADQFRNTGSAQTSSVVFTPQPTVAAPVSGSTNTESTSSFSAVFVPSPTAVAPILVSSTPAEDEEIFFPETTTDFIAPANDEVFSGERLQDSEKPKIVATIGSDIVNGVPQKTYILFSQLNSLNKKALKYSLMRKCLLTETSFSIISETLIQNLQSPLNLLEYKNNKEFLVSANAVIVDEHLQKDNIYIYKLKVDWVPKQNSEITRFSPIPGLTGLTGI
jgi:hypothetical protein